MSNFGGANEFVQKWADALGVDPDRTRRVVIDAQAGSVLRVYVEMIGSERLIDIIVPTDARVEVLEA